MKSYLLAALMCMSVYGQISPTAGAEPFYSEGLVSAAGAVNFCDPHTVAITRTSSTVLTIADGAAAATPQFVRFPLGTRIGPRNRAIVATAVLTNTVSGTIPSGRYVFVFGYMTSAGVFRFAAVVPAGPTYVASGTTPMDVYVSTSREANDLIRNGAGYLWAWGLGTDGSFTNAAGSAQRRGGDCWVNQLDMTVGGTSSTITATAAGGANTTYYTALSLAINTFYKDVIAVPNGTFFEGGLQLQAGTASAVNVRVSGYRIAVAPTVPPSF